MAGERLTFGDVTIVVKVSGESTGGSMSVLEPASGRHGIAWL